jgi:hypothetical protein
LTTLLVLIDLLAPLLPIINFTLLHCAGMVS